MIAIELNHAIAMYSMVLGLLIAGIWVYTEFFVRRPQRVLGKQFLWRCSICGYAYLDEGAETLSQCPRCESYNDAVESRREVSRGAGEEVREVEFEVRAGSKRKRPNQRRRGPRKRR